MQSHSITLIFSKQSHQIKNMLDVCNYSHIKHIHEYVPYIIRTKGDISNKKRARHYVWLFPYSTWTTCEVSSCLNLSRTVVPGEDASRDLDAFIAKLDDLISHRLHHHSCIESFFSKDFPNVIYCFNSCHRSPFIWVELLTICIVN